MANVILPIRRNDLNEITEVTKRSAGIAFGSKCNGKTQLSKSAEVALISRVLQLATSIVQDFSEMTRVVRRVRACSEKCEMLG